VRKLMILVVLSVLLTSACKSSGNGSSTRNDHALDQGAARFAVRTQAGLRLGRFQRVWRSLHPAQKRVVSSARLASCYPRNEFPETVTFRATEVQDVSWKVPGTASPTESKEVTVTAKSPGRPAETFAQHVVRIGGRWTWMLSNKFFRAAKRGTC
jgi:hypothetical protein